VTCVQYLTAHLRRVVREGVAATASSTAAGNDSLTSSSAPPVGQDSKQGFYAKYCLRHIAAPRTHTRKLPPSNVEIEVEHHCGNCNVLSGEFQPGVFVHVRGVYVYDRFIQTTFLNRISMKLWQKFESGQQALVVQSQNVFTPSRYRQKPILNNRFLLERSGNVFFSPIPFRSQWFISIPSPASRLSQVLFLFSCQSLWLWVIEMPMKN